MSPETCFQFLSFLSPSVYPVYSSPFLGNLSWLDSSNSPALTNLFPSSPSSWHSSAFSKTSSSSFHGSRPPRSALHSPIQHQKESFGVQESVKGERLSPPGGGEAFGVVFSPSVSDVYAQTHSLKTHSQSLPHYSPYGSFTQDYNSSLLYTPSSFSPKLSSKMKFSPLGEADTVVGKNTAKSYFLILYFCLVFQYILKSRYIKIT